MAVLRNTRTGDEKQVRDRVVVGRGPASDLRLPLSAVSSEHAVIQWSGADWVIRDLGSRNGTRVNEKLLQRSSFRLVVGDRITFGDPDECWSFVDGSPPVAIATRDDGTEVEAKGGLLLLPDESTPVAAVFARSDRWFFEVEGVSRQVLDSEWICVLDDRFQLRLPSLNPEAERTHTVTPELRIANARIRFRVSLDEEHVEVTLEGNGLSLNVSGRAYHYMLLTLAEHRSAEARAGIPDSEAGFMYVDELAKKLGIDATTLNVHVHRARRVVGFQKARPNDPWFTDAQDLIQRREGQIRLGVRDIVIERSVAARDSASGVALDDHR